MRAVYNCLTALQGSQPPLVRADAQRLVHLAVWAALPASSLQQGLWALASTARPDWQTRPLQKLCLHMHCPIGFSTSRDSHVLQELHSIDLLHQLKVHSVACGHTVACQDRKHPLSGLACLGTVCVHLPLSM